MAQTTRATGRPLSPHLQIYRPAINMVMSIMHRITGVILYVGTLLLAWWLIAIATGPEYYNFVSNVLASIPGKIVLLGYTWTIIHHLLGGIRHLIWDTGRGFDLPMVNRLSWLTIVGSLAITALIWGLGLSSYGVI